MNLEECKEEKNKNWKSKKEVLDELWNIWQSLEYEAHRITDRLENAIHDVNEYL